VGLKFAKSATRGDNFCVTANAPTLSPDSPFQPGVIVVVTLSNPREKFWGALLSLEAEGLSITGVDLASFDGFVQMLKAGEPCTAGILFFPMHRVERIELDLPEGEVPSLSQQLTSKTDLHPHQVLGSAGRP
jgi:hypothetical protein